MIESTHNKMIYTTGVSPVFPFPLPILDPSDLHVFLGDGKTETELTYGTDFTVDAPDPEHGASVTVSKALPMGKTLVIVRMCAPTQSLALPEHGKLPSQGMEMAFDKLTMICQQLKEETDRSVKVSPTESTLTPDALLHSIRASETASKTAAQNAEQSAQAAEAAQEAAAESVEAAARSAVEAAEAAQEAAEAGVPIGSIYAYPAATPPAGAYLLNGQIIASCATLYPKFFEWVQTAGVRLIDTETYDSELSSTGNCGGFVVDTPAGSVRLPSLTNGVIWGGAPGYVWCIQVFNAATELSTQESAQLASQMQTYLPLTGGTVTGDIVMTGTKAIKESSDGDVSLFLIGGTDWEVAPHIVLRGQGASFTPGGVQIAAVDANGNQSSLHIRPDGTMNFCGKDAVCVESWKSSDGSSWYRKYSDGFIEQGGLIVKEPDDAQTFTDVAINFPAPFTTTSYSFSGHAYCSYAGMDRAAFYVKDKSKTVTGIVVFILNNPQIDTDTGLEHHGTWYACGY